MALEALEGKMVFLEGSGGVFVEFLSGQELWRDRTGALVMFGIFFWDFWWIFWVFGGVKS
jgi:hypothetical protein